MHNDSEFKGLMTSIKQFIKEREKKGKILGNQLGKIKYGYPLRTLKTKLWLLLLLLALLLTR